MVSWGKNKNEELGEKMKKGKEKRRKITLKKGKKALKMHLFSYKLKKIPRGVFRPALPNTYFSGDKNLTPKEWGGMIRMHNIYL